MKGAINVISVISLVLIIVGAINWLLIGIFSLDLVATIFGAMSIGSRIVYSLVGVAGIWMLVYLFRKKGKIDDTNQME